MALTIIWGKPRGYAEAHAKGAIKRVYQRLGHDPDRPMIPAVDEALYHGHCYECQKSYWAKAGSDSGHCDYHRELEELQRQTMRESARLELEQTKLELEQLQGRLSL